MNKWACTTIGVGAVLCGLLYACTGEESGVGAGAAGTGANGSGAAGGGTAASGGEGGSGMDFDAGTSDAAEDACAATTAEATIFQKPVDIIIVIDNSGSMGGEIEAVQNNINGNFAQIIEDSGIDYRVILLSEHGEWQGAQSICIEAPLSGIPAGGCDSPPDEPVHNPPVFFHFSRSVSSHNSLCRIIDFFDQPDEFDEPGPGLGWGHWLRDDSFKMFVEITDDNVDCGPFDDHAEVDEGEQVAADFDEALRTLWPLHFGELNGERNYRFYSIVGMEEYDPPTSPWPPNEPIQTGECEDGSAGNGTGYQALSRMTTALRWPSCLNDNFDAIFNAIAEGVIEGASVPCEFMMPEAPPGEEIDPDTLVVAYTPGGTGVRIEFQQVTGPGQCGPNKFYIEGDIITLCPETCEMVTADEEALIEILLGCGTAPT